MKPLDEILRERFAVAIARAFGPDAVMDPVIKTGDPKFADYQANVAMALGKKLGQPPREVAQALVKHLQIDDLCEPPTIAGPGFINLRIKKDWLTKTLTQLAQDARQGSAYRAGVDKTQTSETVVVDYSGPNVAKQMHVGHIRSTIIGDTVARTLEFLGHEVVRQNHIGDFGTQFGMLIHHLREKGLTEQPFTIADLDVWYKEATDRFKKDPAFAEQARKTVVALQSGEATAVALWNRMRIETRKHYMEVYKILGVPLADEHERAESFYGTRLPRIVDRVRKTLGFGGDGASPSSHSGQPPKPWETTAADNLPGMAGDEVKGAMNSEDAFEELSDAGKPTDVKKPFAALSDGALCIFLPGYRDADDNPLPMMIQKSDGGYPYSATDLAALYFRVQEEKTTPEEQRPLNHSWHAGRVIYLTDARQSQHFAMLFDAFRAAKWDHLPGNKIASLEHAPFGSMLGEDRKPYKTREGRALALIGFLQDAIEAAAQEVASKNPDLPAEKQRHVAQAVGIAAVKYADLRNERTIDYVFNLKQMVAFEGNTGPYLQYAVTRVKSIFRKSGISRDELAGAKLLLEAPAELTLAKLLVRFSGVVESVARDLKPNYLCSYLYEVAQAYSSFYENCPVLQAPTPEVRQSRLLLCDLVARTLELGLVSLLGIEVLDEM